MLAIGLDITLVTIINGCGNHNLCFGFSNASGNVIYLVRYLCAFVQMRSSTEGCDHDNH